MVVRTTVWVLMVLAVLLAGCTDDPGDDPGDEAVDAPPVDAPPVEEPTEAVAEEGRDTSTAATVGSVEHVQDLWVYEQVLAIDADGEERDLTDALIAWWEAEAVDTVALPGDAALHVVDGVAAWVLDAGGDARTDVDVQVGLLEYEGERVPTVLGTPHDGAPTIGMDEQLEVDLTPVDGLEVGDFLVVDHGFLQAYPDADEEPGRGPLELLVHRLERDQVRFLGDPEAGEPLLYTAQVGEVVEGSRRGRVPTKAHDMTDGMQRGVGPCVGVRCVVRWFRSFGSGASDSFDNALCNGGLGTNCPPRDDRPRPRPYCASGNCGRSWGDPHLVTFDGVSYSFQAVGEFVLLRTDDLEIQARYLPWAGSDRVSNGTAVALAADGVRFTLQLDEERQAVARLDGEPVAFEELPTALAEVGWEAVAIDGSLVQIVTADGLQVSFTRNSRAFATMINTFIDLGELGPVEGLLGTADGDAETDFVTADAERLAAPPPHEERYGVFADTWRVTDDTSLFDHGDGESTESFTDRDFPAEAPADAADLAAEDQALIARARALCERLGIVTSWALDTCTLDVALTGDVAFAHASVTADVVSQLAEGLLDPSEVTPWHASAPTEGAPVPAAALEATWRSSLRALLGDVEPQAGDRITVVCPPAEGSIDDRVFGTDVYATLGGLCMSAVHAGVITQDDGGTFVVEHLEDVMHPEIEIAARNDVEPRQWMRRGSGYRFVDGAG